MVVGAVTHAGKTDWSNRPQQTPKGKVRLTKVRGVFHSALFHAMTFFFFFFLWAEPFVSAHINALHGLIISHTCHVCHLHSGMARNEKGRTI